MPVRNGQDSVEMNDSGSEVLGKHEKTFSQKKFWGEGPDFKRIFTSRRGLFTNPVIIDRIECDVCDRPLSAAKLS